MSCPRCHASLTPGVTLCPACHAVVPPVGVGARAFDNLATIALSSPGDAQALEPGVRFAERYDIVEHLGPSRRGERYSARDTASGVDLAIDVFACRLDTDEAAARSMVAACLRARRVQHPNVLGLHDVAIWRHQPYATTEVVRGTTLLQWLKGQFERDVPLRAAVGIVTSIAAGLNAVHRAGLVHRFLTPSSILLTGEPLAGDFALKILDLGAAPASEAERVAFRFDPGWAQVYVAPEQLFRPDGATPASDIFSLATLFYELLMGVAPQATIDRVSANRADVPRAIDDLLEQCLSVRARTRLQSIDAFVEALDRAVPARQETPRPPASPPPEAPSPTASLHVPQTDQTPLAVGACFGERFDILHVFGSNFRGDRYAARDRTTGDDVLLELVHRERKTLDGVMSAARMAQRIRHPHVLTLRDVSNWRGQPYLVMELPLGMMLAGWLEQRSAQPSSLPLTVISGIAEAVMDGVADIHRAGLVHRGLMPFSVLLLGEPLAGDYRLKILNLGVAPANTADLAEFEPGETWYVAPEQQSTPERAGPSADVYSMGLLLYDLLMVPVHPQGRPPDGQLQRVSAIRRDVGPTVDTLIGRCLSSAPEDRPQSIDELRTAVALALRALPSHTDPPSIPSPRDLPDIHWPRTPANDVDPAPTTVTVDADGTLVVNITTPGLEPPPRRRAEGSSATRPQPAPATPQPPAGRPSPALSPMNRWSEWLASPAMLHREHALYESLIRHTILKWPNPLVATEQMLEVNAGLSLQRVIAAAQQIGQVILLEPSPALTALPDEPRVTARELPDGTHATAAWELPDGTCYALAWVPRAGWKSHPVLMHLVLTERREPPALIVRAVTHRTMFTDAATEGADAIRSLRAAVGS